MSIESAKKFILNATTGDSEFKDIFKKTFSKFESKDAKLEYITAKAKKLGFDFNTKELDLAFNEMKGKLTEQELANVAGGSSLNNLTDSLTGESKNFWNSLWWTYVFSFYQQNYIKKFIESTNLRIY